MCSMPSTTMLVAESCLSRPGRPLSSCLLQSTCRSPFLAGSCLSFKIHTAVRSLGRRGEAGHTVTLPGQKAEHICVTHPARRISYSETAAHARSYCCKKFQCPSFKYDSTFLTCLSRAHSPPSGTGLSWHRRQRVRDSLRALHADSTDQPHAAVCRLLPLREPRLQTRSSDLCSFVRETCTHLYARL